MANSILPGQYHCCREPAGWTRHKNAYPKLKLPREDTKARLGEAVRTVVK